MDCGFNINHVLPEDITVLDASADFWKNTSVGGGREFMRQQVCTIIDRIGEASAQSQGLLSAITNSHKLRHSDHRLYILKDASANSFRGGVIGYLKVARKKLVLKDSAGNEKQYEPLCLLDFFVENEYQRKGHGTKLFTYMLKREHCQAKDMAIDRPSAKCLSFFGHKFDLSDVVRQPSHFVVFSDFFEGPNSPGSAVLKDKTAAGPIQKTYNGFFTGTSELDGPGDEVKEKERRGSNGSHGAEQQPSPTENGPKNSHVANGHGLPKDAGTVAAGHNMDKNADRVSLRPTRGTNLHYSHTQLW
ncbi:hypothetical protein RvY_18898 [Ramazzottius varieornatus]|uniref:Alpha-tubulin N-acetyltransferase n=1 Tax=Ramazzottius varieornatus TaxID=947166 RepID=A0A1D1WBW4_RAMVA|nr:hypothetical protein RvY_18898 [Ramazzottius varieornatus]